MSPIYVPGKVVLSKIQQYPAVLGEPWGGGYFAGYISHTANGVPTHALIVAPKATGASGAGYALTSTYALKSTRTATNSYSTFDGVTNTAAMVAAGINNHPAAKFCTQLTIGGFTDWYLPSSLEQDIAYFNLKPTGAENYIGSSGNRGENVYAVPSRSSQWTAGYPGQTHVALFSTGSESYSISTHWSSTHDANDLTGKFTIFSNGDKAIGASGFKDSAFNVRAFRRIAL
jgi:hypothetical protein